ncbi:Calcium/calmodulin-dependent protein kinase type 1 [Dinochytrium kinnereticum]|nr:Calcium/calmodulin-dependent protein kinase type 1 [Dinochytrium kinnereticum]
MQPSHNMGFAFADLDSTSTPSSPTTPTALAAARAAGYSPAIQPSRRNTTGARYSIAASARSIRSAKAPSMRVSYSIPSGRGGDSSQHGEEVIVMLKADDLAPPITDNANNFDDVSSDDEDYSDADLDGESKRKSALLEVPKDLLLQSEGPKESPSDTANIDLQIPIPIPPAAEHPTRPLSIDAPTITAEFTPKSSWFTKLAERLKSLKKPKSPPKQDDEAVERYATEQNRLFAEERAREKAEDEALAKEEAEAGERGRVGSRRRGSFGSFGKRSLSRRRGSFGGLGGKKVKDEMVLLDRQKRRQYKFIRVLGAGAQGVVSLHLHLPTENIVALKSISKTLNPTIPTSYHREVEILRKVSPHPSIIRLLDSWEGKKELYQVFQVCTGGDLSTALAGPVPEGKGVRLLAPLVDAVRFIHEMGILHRDVRPANVFLRRPVSGLESDEELGRILVLADFGIATYEKAAGRLDSGLPQDHFPHLAPEIFAKQGRFSKATDNFGLGVIAIQVLLGRGIHIDDHSSTPKDAAYIKLSSEGKSVVAGLLERDPGKRLTAAIVLSGEWVAKWGVEVEGPKA